MPKRLVLNSMEYRELISMGIIIEEDILQPHISSCVSKNGETLRIVIDEKIINKEREFLRIYKYFKKWLINEKDNYYKVF